MKTVFSFSGIIAIGFSVFLFLGYHWQSGGASFGELILPISLFVFGGLMLLLADWMLKTETNIEKLKTRIFRFEKMISDNKEDM